jgi:hypothetical protein
VPWIGDSGKSDGDRASEQARQPEDALAVVMPADHAALHSMAGGNVEGMSGFGETPLWNAWRIQFRLQIFLIERALLAKRGLDHPLGCIRVKESDRGAFQRIVLDPKNCSWQIFEGMRIAYSQWHDARSCSLSPSPDG